MHMFAHDVIPRKNSRFNGLPYYQIDCVGIDPQTGHLIKYHTYAVPGFENFDRWSPIIETAGKGTIVWFTGNIKFKPTNPSMINADSEIHIQDTVNVDQFEDYIRYLMREGIVTNGRKETPMSEIAKQFFDA